MGLIATPGAYRHRVLLQAPAAGGVDGRGQPVEAWVPVAEVWAVAEPLRGREFFAADQQQAQTDVRFTIRHRTDVLASWRIIWQGFAYQLSAPPIDTGGLGLQLELMTARVAGSGVAS